MCIAGCIRSTDSFTSLDYCTCFRYMNILIKLSTLPKTCKTKSSSLLTCITCLDSAARGRDYIVWLKSMRLFPFPCKSLSLPLYIEINQKDKTSYSQNLYVVLWEFPDKIMGLFSCFCLDFPHWLLVDTNLDKRSHSINMITSVSGSQF